MMREGRKRKRFGKDISRHVSGRYPSCGERAGKNMVANKVMAYINVLGTGRDSWGVRKRASSLVVAKNRERPGNWEFQYLKESAKPKHFLKSMSHSVVFCLRR